MERFKQCRYRNTHWLCSRSFHYWYKGQAVAQRIYTVGYCQISFLSPKTDTLFESSLVSFGTSTVDY